MKRLILMLLVYVAGFGLQAQNLPFGIDHSFQPFFDFRDDTVTYSPEEGFVFQRAGEVNDIWEDTNTGKIYLVGDFDYRFNAKHYSGHACLYNDGSLFEGFNFALPGGSGQFFPINDSTFLSGKSNGEVFLMDTLANVDLNWSSNFRNLVVCVNTYRPFFFNDGSSLWTGPGCDIVVPPDTFPDHYILKVDPQGNFDPTFIVEADIANASFIRYDSNRILMYAPPRFIYNYGNHQVNGIWRIYLDGTLDTTFHAPISDVWASGDLMPIVEDGKIFILGYYLLEGNSTYHTLIRLNEDGSLDTTFINHAGPINTASNSLAVTAIAPTEDGGYLVGGIFNEYQGHEKKGIAKIDHNGTVEPQYFIGQGIDSSFIGSPSINKILPSAFGGYYVVGNFRSWNGQPSQPIIRLHGLNVGMEEHGQEIKELKLFPNPAKESIQFYGIGANEIEQLFLTDIQGKTLKADFRETSLNTYEMNISNLKTGMYFLKIISDGEVGVGKFVKE